MGERPLHQSAVEVRQMAVQKTVVEGHAQGREGGDRPFDDREGDKGLAPGQSSGENAAGVASDPQAGHEGRGDDRHRMHGDAGGEAEKSLPRDLIDESGRSAQKKKGCG